MTKRHQLSSSPVLLALCAALVGCGQVFIIGSDTGAAGGGDGGEGGAQGGGGEAGSAGAPSDCGDTAEAFFERCVKGGGGALDLTAGHGLIESCGGVGCHASAEAPLFLPPGSEYQALSGYIAGTGKKLIVPNAEQSLLLTYPQDGTRHVGGAIWASPAEDELEANVLAWLQLEALLLPQYPFLEVGPINVAQGINTFSLGQFDIGDVSFPDASIVFYAEVAGTPPELISLSELEVYPAVDRALRISDPSFAIYPPGDGDPNHAIVDTSLQADDPIIYFVPDATQLGNGEVVLPAWMEGSRLALRFLCPDGDCANNPAIELLYADGDGNTYDACHAPDLFAAAVDDLAVNPADPISGPLLCAEQCHAGTDEAATSAMDLAPLLQVPPDPDFACAVMRTFIAPGDVDGSPIVTLTMPQPSPPHPFVFEGNTSKWNAFKNGMADWINAR